MGCDIHGVFQAKRNGKWADIENPYDERRHYQLFAVLAGVRNGLGFAGTPTGGQVTPISEPRGFPDDFEVDGESHPIEDLRQMSAWSRKYFSKEDRFEVWMGDHSHSWLTADEILDWAAPVVQKCGYISKEEYEKWDKVSRPSNYSGGIWGHGIICTEDPNSDGWTHVLARWNSDLKEELKYFFDIVAELKRQHGEVRFVFGFDS